MGNAVPLFPQSSIFTALKMLIIVQINRHFEFQCKVQAYMYIWLTPCTHIFL
jgi:hypothetical protein